MPIIAVAVFMGTLFVREVAYLSIKHHQATHSPVVAAQPK